MSNALDSGMIDAASGADVKYASFWTRVAASLIDFVVLLPIIGLSFYNIFNLKAIWLLFVVAVISLLYKVIMESEYKATVGKMAMKIQVIKSDGSAMSLGQSVYRNVLSILPNIITFYFQFLMLQSADYLAADSFVEMSALQQNYQPLWVNFLTIPLLISCLVVAFDAKNQALHDRFVPTYVIHKSKS